MISSVLALLPRPRPCSRPTRPAPRARPSPAACAASSSAASKREHDRRASSPPHIPQQCTAQEAAYRAAVIRRETATRATRATPRNRRPSRSTTPAQLPRALRDGAARDAAPPPRRRRPPAAQPPPTAPAPARDDRRQQPASQPRWSGRSRLQHPRAILDRRGPVPRPLRAAVGCARRPASPAASRPSSPPSASIAASASAASARSRAGRSPWSRSVTASRSSRPGAALVAPVASPARPRPSHRDGAAWSGSPSWTPFSPATSRQRGDRRRGQRLACARRHRPSPAISQLNAGSSASRRRSAAPDSRTPVLVRDRRHAARQRRRAIRVRQRGAARAAPAAPPPARRARSMPRTSSAYRSRSRRHGRHKAVTAAGGPAPVRPVAMRVEMRRQPDDAVPQRLRAARSDRPPCRRDRRRGSASRRRRREQPHPAVAGRVDVDRIVAGRQRGRARRPRRARRRPRSTRTGAAPSRVQAGAAGSISSTARSISARPVKASHISAAARARPASRASSSLVRDPQERLQLGERRRRAPAASAMIDRPSPFLHAQGDRARVAAAVGERDLVARRCSCARRRRRSAAPRSGRRRSSLRRSRSRRPRPGRPPTALADDRLAVQIGRPVDRIIDPRFAGPSDRSSSSRPPFPSQGPGPACGPRAPASSSDFGSGPARRARRCSVRPSARRARVSRAPRRRGLGPRARSPRAGCGRSRWSASPVPQAPSACAAIAVPPISAADQAVAAQIVDQRLEPLRELVDRDRAGVERGPVRGSGRSRPSPAPCRRPPGPLPTVRPGAASAPVNAAPASAALPASAACSPSTSAIGHRLARLLAGEPGRRRDQRHRLQPRREIDRRAAGGRGERQAHAARRRCRSRPRRSPTPRAG